MARVALVELTNDEGKTAKVMPSSVALYEKRGWTVVDDGGSEKSSVPEPGTQSPSLIPTDELEVQPAETEE